MIDGFLSAKGRRIQWPKKGILQQTADAKNTEVDATIGIALEENGEPMHLSTMETNILPQDAFPYAPGFGVTLLRKEWKDELAEKDPDLKSPSSLPVVTSGLTHALSVIGHLFLDPGNEIILPDLFWGNYKLIFEQSYDAKLVTFPTFAENSFNEAGLKEKLLAPGDKKLLLLNFPNNPTGYTPTEDEVKGIITIVEEAANAGKNVLVILDDAYFGLVYETGIRKESLFAELAELHENVLVVKVDGATKEEFAWGFRLGFLTYAGSGLTSEDLTLLEEKTAAVVRATVSNCNHLGQSMLLEALQNPQHAKEKTEKFEILKKRYETVKEIVSNETYTDAFTALPFNSGYFMCIKLNDGIEAEAVRQKLLKEFSTGVIALPGNLLRIAYSGVPLHDLERLFENIASACE